MGNHGDAARRAAHRDALAGHECGQLAGQGLPERVFVFLARVIEKLPVAIRRIGMRGVALVRETHVVRMHIHQGHAAMPRNPIELLIPDIGMPLL